VELEILARRHQIGVVQHANKRRRLSPAVRLLWVFLSRIWSDWRSALAIVKPETVIGWYRRGFLVFWTWKVRRGNPGRPRVSRELRDLGRVAHEPATATKNQTECHPEMYVLTTASAEITGIDRRATVWRSLSRPTCHFELHHARQPLRWPMSVESGHPGSCHPTLKFRHLVASHIRASRSITSGAGEDPQNFRPEDFANPAGSRRTDTHNLADGCAAGFSMGFPLASFVSEKPSRSFSPRG
jgi:hypothetical protein